MTGPQLDLCDLRHIDYFVEQDAPKTPVLRPRHHSQWWPKCAHLSTSTTGEERESCYRNQRQPHFRPVRLATHCICARAAFQLRDGCPCVAAAGRSRSPPPRAGNLVSVDLQRRKHPSRRTRRRPCSMTATPAAVPTNCADVTQQYGSNSSENAHTSQSAARPRPVRACGNTTDTRRAVGSPSETSCLRTLSRAAKYDAHRAAGVG